MKWSNYSESKCTTIVLQWWLSSDWWSAKKHCRRLPNWLHFFPLLSLQKYLFFCISDNIKAFFSCFLRAFKAKKMCINCLENLVYCAISEGVICQRPWGPTKQASWLAQTGRSALWCLKVRKSENKFMKSSFLSKYESIFGSYFWRNDDFGNIRKIVGTL